MDWNDFLNRFAGQPLFHSSLLTVFPDPLSHTQVQLSRWTKAGQLSQIRRGWYLIEKPWRVKDLSIPVVANTIVHPSYLSLEWALQYYYIIPEYVPNPTSVTTSRGTRFAAMGALFIYHHVQSSFFLGYNRETIGDFTINIACPEKALLDKIYLFLQRNRFSIEWLVELRLQELDDFDLEKFEDLCAVVNNKKLNEAAAETCRYINVQKGDS